LRLGFPVYRITSELDPSLRLPFYHWRKGEFRNSRGFFLE
jgi:hypothetical protein